MDVSLLFFVRCENFGLYRNKRLLRADPCCHSVIKEFAHASSCAYIELWMHLGSLESTPLSKNKFLNFDCFFDLCSRSCKESGSRTATVPSISNNQPLAIRSEVKISAQEG